jgi:hypothetical protein
MHVRIVTWAACILTASAAAAFAGPEERKPVPGSEDQDRATKLIREVYAEDLKRTKPDDQRALARKLFEQSKETRDDPAARYVLLREAAAAAARAGDAETVARAIAELAAIYNVNAVVAKWMALEKVKAITRESASALVSALLELADDAIGASEYTIAVTATGAAFEHAGRTGDAALEASVRTRREEVLETKRAYDEVAAAWKQLESDRDEPVANLAVGTFLCLYKGSWEEGLPLLAKGADPAFAAAAADELKSPTESADMLRQGDAWWDLADAQKIKMRAKAMRARAALWYEKVLPEATGLTKAKLEKRLAAVASSSAPPVKKRPSAKPVDKPQDFTTICASLHTWKNAAGVTEEQRRREIQKVHEKTRGKPVRLVGRVKEVVASGRVLELKIDFDGEGVVGWWTGVSFDAKDKGTGEKLLRLQQGDKVLVEGVVKYADGDIYPDLGSPRLIEK